MDYVDADDGAPAGVEAAVLLAQARILQTPLTVDETRAESAATAPGMPGGDPMLFVTGAGISADSGLPTYRGVGGLYNRGETEDGVVIEQAFHHVMPGYVAVANRDAQTQMRSGGGWGSMN